MFENSNIDQNPEDDSCIFFIEIEITVIKSKKKRINPAKNILSSQISYFMVRRGEGVCADGTWSFCTWTSGTHSDSKQLEQ